jgi:hypothetical protein
LRAANTIAAGVVNEHRWRGLCTDVASLGECLGRSAPGGAVVALNIQLVAIKLDGKEDSPCLRRVTD